MLASDNRSHLHRLGMVFALVAFMLSFALAGETQNGAGPIDAVGLEAAMAGNFPKSWDVAAGREMARNISKLPDPVVVELLWLTAAAPPRFDTTNIFINALGSKSAVVRGAALSLLAAQQTDDARRLLLSSVSTESNPKVVESAVQALAALPRNQAVQGLMDLMLVSSSGNIAVGLIGPELRRLTRAEIADNPGDWRDWWLDNEDYYQ